MIQITSLGSKVFEGLRVAADWIYDLNSSNSRKQKERVIERALIASRLGSSSAQCFLYNCYLAYNPFFVYHTKSVPETQDLSDKENPWIEFWGLIEDLRTTKVSGYKAERSIERMSSRFDSDEWNLVARPVILKDLRCGISTKTLNNVLGSTEWKIPVFDCQHSQDSENHPRQLSGRKWIEPKLDGSRALAVITASSVVMHSRTGKVLKNFKHLEKLILENIDIFDSQANLGTRYVIDGEIITKDEMLDDAVFYIFDVIPLSDFIDGSCEIQQHYRHEIIQNITKKLHQRTPFIRGLNGIEVDLSTSEGHNIMHRYARSSVNDGFEGIMIKDLNAPYFCGNSSAWLKWKPSISNAQ